jgi:hypothetical protein
MQRVAEATKCCAKCGQTMSRRRYGGRLEDLSVFQRRKFCSLSCANSKAEVGKQGNLWRARKHAKPSCEACGERRSLHVHHVNQVQSDNRPENLQTLCKWCHNFLHATAKRLGLSVAGRMVCLALRPESPNEWTALSASETPSCPKSRNSSAEPS